jgi:hypothetical protein
MCTVLLPPGVNPIAVNKYIIIVVRVIIMIIIIISATLGISKCQAIGRMTAVTSRCETVSLPRVTDLLWGAPNLLKGYRNKALIAGG